MHIVDKVYCRKNKSLAGMISGTFILPWEPLNFTGNFLTPMGLLITSPDMLQCLLLNRIFWQKMRLILNSFTGNVVLSKDCLQWHHVKILFWVVISSEKNRLVTTGHSDQYVLIVFRIGAHWSSCNQPVLFRTNYYSKENFYMVSLQTVFTYPVHCASYKF